MIDFKNIAIGYINATKNWFGISSEEVELKAIERYTICLGCNTLSDDKTRCDRTKGGCNCKIWYKVRSDSKCPKEKW